MQPLTPPNGAVPPLSREAVLHSFGDGTGANPYAGLTDVDGVFYGTTALGGTYDEGTVFKVNTSGVAFVLHEFGGGKDGAYPSGLINVNGVLYGTTLLGGANGGGTVFKIETSSAESVLYSFAGGNDGSQPSASLTAVNGVLYGTTTQGGTAGAGAEFGNGTVFKVTTSGMESVLYRFAGGSDGSQPSASLTEVNGMLYGTTIFGGGKGCSGYARFGCGTVFGITLSGTESILHRFGGGSDGALTDAGLSNVAGVLYGTTPSGGRGSGKACGSGGQGCGTVFKTTLSGTESILARFEDASNGLSPAAGLTNVDGVLYGTTTFGGNGGLGTKNSNGTVFKITTTGVESTLYRFAGGSDGANPEANVIDVDGVLYGTTLAGGAHGKGTVFSLSL